MSFLSSKKLFALVSFLSISFILSGCGVWRNFTTYFNTYYNAKTLFDQTEETILKQQKDIFQFRPDQKNTLQTGLNGYNQTSTQQNQFQNNQNRNQNQYGQQQYNSNANNANQYSNQTQSNQFANSTGVIATGNIAQDLTKVIEKCSKILQYENKSAYFPDALFIAGKALYYQEEYSKAQRKFTELAGLGETGYSLVNKLWLAKTNLQLFNIDDGLKQTEEVKEEALTDGDFEIFSEAVITRISFFIYRGDFTKAVVECNSFLENSKAEEMNGLIAFQLGMIYQRMGDKQNALDAYKNVLKFDPTPEIELKSRLEYAKLLKSLDKIEESQEELERLSSEGKFKSNLDEIYIELGNVYVAQNKIERAIDLYKIVDTTYKQQATSGMASLKLAEVYKSKVHDLDSAQKYYGKIVNTYLSNDVKKDADITARNILRYFTYKEEYASLTKKLSYIENPQLYLRDSTDYASAANQVIEEGKALLEKQNSQSADASQSISQRAAQAKMTQDQLLQQSQQQITAERQRQRFDRRNPQALLQNQQRTMNLKELIILGKAKKPERLVASRDSAKQLIATNLFGLGSLFYSELEYPDSAYIYFDKVLRDYPNKSIIPQTMYSLATYFETNKDTLKADSLYKIIYDKYPKNKLWEPAGIKLGLIKKEEKQIVVKVTEDPAEKPYLVAEQLYFSKKYKEAADTFYTVYKQYPKSSYASKALYFAGMINEENFKNYDSAAAVYGKIVEEFKTDPLSQVVSPKYLAYQAEKDRIKKEAEAKLKAEELKRKEEEAKLKQTQNPVPENPPANINTQNTVEVPKPELTPSDSTMQKPALRDTSQIKRRKLIE